MNKFTYYMWDDDYIDEQGILYKYDGKQFWVYNGHGKIIHWKKTVEEPGFVNNSNIYTKISEAEFLMRTMQ